ncbi:MAG: nitrophenyl compound nitroreductase subunit ArsF family protein [Candidatus Paceibacterota bacterium]
MNKKIIIGVGIIALIILAIFLIKPRGNTVSENSNSAGASRVQIFLFHATQRCPTCIRIGQLSKSTVEERFSEQLKTGKIEFREINIDLPENKALAEKFQVGGSAFFINSIKNGEDDIAEDTMVWQLAGGMSDKFKDYLTNKLNTILGI